MIIHKGRKHTYAINLDFDPRECWVGLYWETHRREDGVLDETIVLLSPLPCIGIALSRYIPPTATEMHDAVAKLMSLL